MHNYFKDMAEENVSQEFRLKIIDETRNSLIEEINQNELSKKQKKLCKTLNYIENFLILASTVTGSVSIFSFVFFSWYSYKNSNFCNWIKNLCNNCRN